MLTSLKLVDRLSDDIVGQIRTMVALQYLEKVCGQTYWRTYELARGQVSDQAWEQSLEKLYRPVTVLVSRSVERQVREALGAN